jgi:hypothetical protein
MGIGGSVRSKHCSGCSTLISNMPRPPHLSLVVQNLSAAFDNQAGDKELAPLEEPKALHPQGEEPVPLEEKQPIIVSADSLPYLT